MREKYITENIIGSGTYGTVRKARDRINGEYVAIKKITIDNFDDGIPASTMREIGVLLELNQYKHPNIIGIQEIIHKDRGISIVFDFIEWDLKRYMEVFNNSTRLTYNRGLPLILVKSFTRQILDALRFCHQYKIIHRDLKPSNILLNNSGIIKLADFGLARLDATPRRTYSHEVVTLWYRAPEIILGTTGYGIAIDIWSVGCICYELATGNVLFMGDSEIDQLFRIFMKFGTPTEFVWPGVGNLQDFKQEFPKFNGTFYTKKEILKDIQDFLDGMLQLDPRKRLQADEIRRAKFLRDARIIPVS